VIVTIAGAVVSATIVLTASDLSFKSSLLKKPTNVGEVSLSLTDTSTSLLLLTTSSFNVTTINVASS
jgi:hypothetical protein